MHVTRPLMALFGNERGQSFQIEGSAKTYSFSPSDGDSFRSHYDDNVFEGFNILVVMPRRLSI